MEAEGGNESAGAPGIRTALEFAYVNSLIIGGVPMGRGPRVRSESGIYHVILRGANRQEIFHDDQDCDRFLTTVLRYKMSASAKVYAWCLMGNHVHLLIKEGQEDISSTMKRAGISFVRYYNDKYDATGHLFQDRFRSEPIETDGSLLRVTRYIHQNPVKAGLVHMACDWQWSSCSGYYYDVAYPENLLDSDYVLDKYGKDRDAARWQFIEFNENANDDEFLDNDDNVRKRLSDEEARREIVKFIGERNITQVKGLPKTERDQILRRVKEIPGVSQRQAARILGIPPSLIFKA
ncbi:MAG: transposase [Bacillota bacterium]|nr:transposase [Bacillota bacterium]